MVNIHEHATDMLNTLRKAKTAAEETASETLHSAADTGAHSWRQARSQASRQYAETAKRASRLAEQGYEMMGQRPQSMLQVATRLISRNPGLSVAAAFGLGLAFGLASRDRD